MNEKKQVIKESDELWLELSQLAHFDDTAYDEELKNSIKDSLELGSEDITNELRKNNISTTKLLAALLKALEPFSQMMVELLSLYSNAGARSNNNNIEIEFEFGDESKRYSLDDFKKSVYDVQERTVIKARLQDPWKLINRMKSIEDGRFSESNNLPEYDYYKQICVWLDTYRNDILPECLPEFPVTQCDQLDRKLNQLVELVEDVIQCYRNEYLPSIGLKQSILQAAEKYNTKIWWAETDHWIGKFVLGYFYLVLFLKYKLLGDNDIDGAIEYVDKIMADPEIFSIVTEKEQYNAICEILDMPFWKYRYEMYSAWVFTCIAEAFSDLGIRYNVPDGVLQFKFSGVMLATISLPDMEFEIWAEKRHPANNLSGEGRVSGIQPDYTIYSKTKEKTEACIVIECKQYKKSNKKNFASAVNDYATALPGAMVFLTNYGRISKNFSKWFKLEILRRSKDYGTMRPNSKSRLDFISDVRNYAEAVWKDHQFKNNSALVLWEERPTHFKVELTWQKTPVDLDLEVAVRTHGENNFVNFFMVRNKDKYPYAYLEKDFLEGPATETINITNVISGFYDIYIRHYYHRDHEDESISGEVEVKISADNQYCTVCKIGNWMTDKKWHVGAFNAIGFVKRDTWENT